MRPRILALSAMLLVLFYGTASAAFKHVEDGMVFPGLSGRDLGSGETVSSEGLIADGSEVVVVVFWATWSARSLELLGDLKAMVTEHADRRFQVIAVNVEGQRISAATRKKIEAALAELNLPFPSLLDPELALFDSYGVVAVPSTAILDSNHILRSGPSGYSYVVRDAIVDSISVLLGLKAVTASQTMSLGYQPQKRALRYFNLAVKLANQGQLKRALSNAERAVAADTLFGSPHSLIGQIRLDRSEAEAAAAAFSRAAALDPTSVATLAGWGQALMQLNRLDEARGTLEKALALDPTYLPTLLNLARCRLRQGDGARAEMHLLAALELNPRDPEVLFSLGAHYRNGGRDAEALAAYRTALAQLGHEIIEPAH